MPGSFIVLTISAFERDSRKVSQGSRLLIDPLEGIVASLREGPTTSAAIIKIKKLASVKSREGQWRIRWRDYRLCYDILGQEIVMHTFRHRKGAY